MWHLSRTQLRQWSRSGAETLKHGQRYPGQLDGGGGRGGHVHPGRLPYGPGQVLLVLKCKEAGQDVRGREGEANHHGKAGYSSPHRWEDVGADHVGFQWCPRSSWSYSFMRPSQLWSLHQQHHPWGITALGWLCLVDKTSTAPATTTATAWLWLWLSVWRGDEGCHVTASFGISSGV